MNIYHLKYFLDAALYQSISKSASINLVSHSAISQGIKNLENFLDVKLMLHSKRRFQLTSEGELFLSEGRQLLDLIEQSKLNLKSSLKEPWGEFTLWLPKSLIVDSFFDVLSEYRKKYPKVKISIKTGAASQVRSAISANEAHLGILIDDGHLGNFEAKTIKSGNFVIVSKQKSETLKSAPLLVTSREKIEVQHLQKRFKSKFKSDLPISMEVMSWGVIRSLVLKKFGMGYVPDYCVAQELESKRLYKIPTPWPSFQYEMKAIWPPRKQIHQNAKLFLQLLKTENSLS